MHELSISQAFEEFKVSEIESIVQKEIDQGKNPLKLSKKPKRLWKKLGKGLRLGITILPS